MIEKKYIALSILVVVIVLVIGYNVYGNVIQSPNFLNITRMMTGNMFYDGVSKGGNIGDPILDEGKLPDLEKPGIVTYDYNSINTCRGNLCNILIGGSYAFDVDGKWKSIDEAFSLKDSNVKCNVISDGKNIAECLDWNMTYRTISLKVDDSLKGKDIPIKVYSPNLTMDSKDLTGDYKKDYVVKSQTGLNFKSKDDVKIQTISAGYSDIIEFGENSTTIKLQTADTENLEDVYGREGDTTDNGALTTLYAGALNYSGYHYNIYIKFNMSSIPSGQQINEVILALYHYDDYSTTSHAGETLYVYGSSNQTWVESPFSDWTTQGPAIDSGIINSTTNRSVDDAYYWVLFNVTSWTSSKYVENSKNVTFMINRTSIGELLTTDACTFYSKEYTTNTALRPQLNITYTTDTTTPTYSLNSTNSTLAGTWVNHTLNLADTAPIGVTAGLSSYTFQFCNGTWNGSMCLATCQAETINLILNDTNKGNVADSYVDLLAPTTNYGATTPLTIGSKTNYNANQRGYIMWNLTSIPSNAIINSANFSFRITGANSYPQIGVWNTSLNWQETNITYNAQPTILTKGTNTASPNALGFWGINISDILIPGVNNSIMFTNNSFYGSTNYWLSIDSKEDSTAGDKPQLNITYTTPSYIGNCGWTNDTAVVISGTNYLTNVSKLANSTANANVSWCYYFNDTSDNWNGTSCVNPFSYLTTSAGGDTCDCTSIQAGTIVNCAENCDITTACDANGQNIVFSGGGTVLISAQLLNYKDINIINGCNVICYSGCKGN